MTELLAYSDTGSGPPILLIHGMTFSRHTWDPIADRLRDRFRCVAIDLPGHGESTGSGADPRAVGDRVHATVATLGLERPLVVGHSAGAIMATGYVADHAATGVVNVDQTLAVGGFAGFVQQLAPALRGEDFDSAFAPFRHSIGVEALPEPERSRVARTQTIRQELVLDHWHGPLTVSPPELQGQVDDLLDRITVPYLWIAGAAVAPADREHLLRHLPTAEIEEWPNHGHMVHLVDPDRFANRVADFAAEVAAG